MDSEILNDVEKIDMYESLWTSENYKDQVNMTWEMIATDVQM